MAGTTRRLDELEPGAVGVVAAVDRAAAGELRQRLMEMGLVPGTPLRLIKRAPFGDPLEVRVLSYNLSLRRDEAQWVLVQVGGQVNA